MEERFESLTAHEREWIGAIAVERTLPRTALAKLAGSRDLEGWIARALKSGLLVAPANAELGVHRDFEQPVLRQLAATNELEAIAYKTATLLEGRSVADITLALQSGDLAAFSRHVMVRRLPRAVPLPSASEWLRTTVCAPLNPEWMGGLWGERAVLVGARVLSESLEGPYDCGALASWLRTKLGDVDDDDRAHLQRLLCEHLVLRGDTADIEALDPPRAHRAAARYIVGDVEATRALLEKPLDDGGGALAPIVALLLAARDTDGARNAAKKLVSGGAARAFRILLKYLTTPSPEHRRIDVHQVGAAAGAWEILLSALTVHLHLQQPWVRASWAREVARRAIEWRDAGYAWLSRQGLYLAHALDAEYCDHELASRRIVLTESSEPRLLDLLTKKPDWQNALDALAAVSSAASQAEARAVRVAWFVDMSDGAFAKPALQEHRAGVGFTQGQRVTVAELHHRRHELPPEDARVVENSRESRAGVRELTPDAYEALIGHPRVFNGARGMLPVEVVRGSFRVETADDAGYVRMVVEPAGAKLGVNVVAESESRLVVYRIDPVMQRVIEALPHGVRVPRTHESELLRVLSKLSETIEVRSPLLAAEHDAKPDCTPCVRIAVKAGAWAVQLGVRPFGDEGRFFVAATGRPSVTLHKSGTRLRCARDFDRERANVEALVARCPTLVAEPREDDLWFLGEVGMLTLLAELRDSGVACNLEWPDGPAIRLRGTLGQRSLRIGVQRLRDNKGWYLASGSVRIDDVTDVALSDLLRAPALDNGRFVRLPDGDYVEVEERVRRVVAALAAHTPDKRAKGSVPIHPAAVKTLRALEEGGIDVDDDARDWVRAFDAMASREWAVPATLRATLREYQLEGFRWLRRWSELGIGACLADDMGLGKTVQIIALLLAREADGPALVVAPTSVCGNWARELARFAPSLRVVEFDGEPPPTEPGTVTICSYAMLQQNEASLVSQAWATAVLDEAQFIKNAESLRAQAAFRIRAHARVAATGTPVENHYGDLWSIFEFLNPGLLGDWPTFKRRFVHPVESGSTNHAPPDSTLRALVHPYVLRRRKSEVLTELPPVTEVQHDVHLSEQDSVRYALLRKRIHAKLFTPHGRRHSKLEVLAELTRLRRFCCHPRLVFPEAEAESAKVDAFLELAEELRENGHRALVFSQYVDFLALVREQLDDRGIRYEYLDGRTPAKARTDRVDAFQRGDASFFLISLKAGGFGLNLTAADYVIHLDPWWNPAVEAQATDRAHRIGQDRKVTVYRLVTKHTIEEDIVELHRKKQKLARALLDEGGAPTADELVELLG